MKLWSPFAKRRYLCGVMVDGRVVHTPSERAAALAAHWAPTFAEAPSIDERAARRYMNRFSPRLTEE